MVVSEKIVTASRLDERMFRTVRTASTSSASASQSGTRNSVSGAARTTPIAPAAYNAGKNQSELVIRPTINLMRSIRTPPLRTSL